MLSTPPTPQGPSPHKKLPHIGLIFTVLLVALVVLGFVGTLQVLGSRAQMHVVASGTVATTTSISTATTTSTPIPSPTLYPESTPTTVAFNADIRVTQNQNMRPSCMDAPALYTVAMLNAGDVTANWHVAIPFFSATFAPVKPSNAATKAQPLMFPHSSTPFWASASPQEGSIAPGQTASFVINPLTAMPCGGASYDASVQLSFPSGASQADIPLTYAGTGPVPHSNVVLVSGSQNITEPCPTGGTAPSPFTFAIKNTGNGTAYPSIGFGNDYIKLTPWASLSVTYNPSNPPVSTWLFAGETWTVTVTPVSIVKCGQVYHIYVYINNTQGESSTMTFTDTFA